MEIKFLEKSDIELLLHYAKKTNSGIRDHLIVLMGFRHGLRASEIAGIKLSDLNLKESRLKVNRLKQGFSTVQPILGDELRAIKRYQKIRVGDPTGHFGVRVGTGHFCPYLFQGQRGPLSRQGIYKIITKIAKKAGFKEKIHPHVLRHSCGYELANNGANTRTIQDYLGHRNIQNTVIYTKLSPKRFEGLF